VAASLSAEEQEQFRLLLARMIAADCPAPDAETRLE